MSEQPGAAANCTLCGEPMEGHGYWNACQTPERRVARLESQLSQALRERDEALDTANFRKSISSGEYCPHACEFPLMERLRTARDQALRELGEAREEIKFRNDACAAILKEDERLRSSNAELRGALEEIDAEINRARRQFVSPSCNIISDAINRALASSSTKET